MLGVMRGIWEGREAEMYIGITVFGNGWLRMRIVFEFLRAGRAGDRIPVRGEIFRTRRDWPWGPSSLLYNGYRVFRVGKAAEAWR